MSLAVPSPLPPAAMNDASTPVLGTMDGTWILDKRRSAGMRGYLETMGVTELAIEAHEKGEADHETINIIETTETTFKIKKMSRVTDITLELELGKELKQNLPGEGRVKTTLAESDSPGKHVKITSRMPTMNGMATVVDTKTLQRERNILVLVQTLVILNERLKKQHTTVRYFMPYHGDVEALVPAVTAKGNLKP